MNVLPAYWISSLILLAGHSAARQATYAVQPIVPPAGQVLAFGGAVMSSTGDVALPLRDTAAPPLASEVWVESNGAWRQLPNPPGILSSCPGDMAADGTVIATGVGAVGQWSLTWTPSGAVSRLRHLPGTQIAFAHGLNDTGLIVGTSGGGGGPANPVQWRNGILQALPFGPGGAERFPCDVNNAGWIVGAQHMPGANFGDAVILPPNGNAAIAVQLPAPLTFGSLAGINDREVAVGSAWVGFLSSQQALYVRNFVGRVVPHGPGVTRSFLLAVNAGGLAVGSGGSSTQAIGVVTDGSVVFDLNTLLDSSSAAQWTVTSAFGIDDAGVVLALVQPSGGGNRSFCRLVPQ